MIEEKRKVPNQTQYEVVDKDGRTWGPFESLAGAAEHARRYYPDQERDEDRTGKGWDVQVVGCES